MYDSFYFQYTNTCTGPIKVFTYILSIDAIYLGQFKGNYELKKTKLLFTRDWSHQLSIIQGQKINLVRLLMFSFIFKISSLNEYSIKFKSQITGFIIK